MKKTITGDHFFLDDWAKNPSKMERQLQDEMALLLKKYGMTEWFCGMSRKDGSGILVSECSDVFFEHHIEVCMKIYDKANSIASTEKVSLQ